MLVKVCCGVCCGTCVLVQVDRPSASSERCGQTASALFDLFASLGASDEQLDFPILYASAKQVGG